MLRHAEMPNGSRRAPNVYRRVHSRPVTRHSGSASSICARTFLCVSSLLNLSCNIILLASHLINSVSSTFSYRQVFPSYLRIAGFYRRFDRSMDQRPQLRASRGSIRMTHGIWACWSCCAASSAPRFSTSSTTGVTTRPMRATFSVGRTLQAGGVFSGGLIGAAVAAVWYIRKHRMPALATWDAFAPGLALGHAIGRVGCFAAGCCYGKPTSHFWGVTFTNPIANRIPILRSAYRLSRHSFLKQRSSWQTSSF